ncbi:MAG: hypothetical protein EP343_09320 [Deltaproteobacteria bacterium]|nr:MAG: hypothetical protein EP343_09320 [Deltaproteobacteria bacterium]
MSIRLWAEQIDVESLVGQCARRTGLSDDAFQDAFYEVLLKMLAKESQFYGQFENRHAFEGYLRLSITRRVIRLHQQKTQRERRELTEPQTVVETPEELMLLELEKHSMAELVDNVMSQYAAPRGVAKDIRTLVKLLLSSDQFVSVRQTGKDKGKFVFQVEALSQALGWTRYQVRERLKLLQQAFVRESKS